MAKKALISTVEPRESGYRVAQVVDSKADTFEVADTLFWADCADNVVADQFYYNTVDKEIYPVPEPALEPPPAPEIQIPNS